MPLVLSFLPSGSQTANSPYPLFIALSLWYFLFMAWSLEPLKSVKPHSGPGEVLLGKEKGRLLPFSFYSAPPFVSSLIC